jgi:hypothetical protein
VLITIGTGTVLIPETSEGHLYVQKIGVRCSIAASRIAEPIFLKTESGSSVSIVSDYGLNDRTIDVRYRQKQKGFFPLASVSRQDLGPTQPPVQWVPGVLSLGLKRGRGVTPSSAEVENEWEL